jgi:hypothetical protein
MRVLRYSSPQPDDRDVPTTLLSLVGNRLVAARYGQGLRLYDLEAPHEPLAHIPDFAQYALQPEALLVSDSSGRTRRYEPSHGTWHHVAELPVPLDPSASSPAPRRLLLSPSGHYLLVESAPISTGPITWPVAHAYLLDARTGAVNYDVPLRKTHVRASFGVLPTGTEVLFLSAESYMSVQMVECASGQLLHEYEVQHEAFCHTDYTLSADGRRLMAFGCFWAGPYEARIYDATPWTQGAPPSAGFPLPLVYRQEEVFESDTVLPIEPRETTDGAVTCLALASLAYGWPRGSPEEAEGRDELEGADREIFDALREFPPTAGALVIRRVDPESGKLAGWSVHQIGHTDERHVHTLSHHRVLVINERVQLVDALANTVTDHGPTPAAGGAFVSAATTDGEAVLLWHVE